MNSEPFTGETNPSPSSWGVRQNSFHRNSCGSLQYSPELTPLLSWEVEAFHLSDSRGNCGLLLSTESTVKGAHRPQTNFAFGFAKRGWAPTSRRGSEICTGISCKEHAVNVPDPIPGHLMFLWLIWGIQLPEDQS